MRKPPVMLRETNGLAIWFADERNIYVEHKFGITLFTRWEVRQRGFWSENWRPFRKALTNNRHLDLAYITRLATLYDISIRYVGRLPESCLKEQARIIPEKGRARNVNHK